MKLNIKNDFPILKQKINGRPLVYLDNAATSQKPRAVIKAIQHFYETTNANVHRGIHTLSENATAAYELTREKTAKFINAKREEIIFTKSCTESINCVATAWGRANLKPGDEIIVSALEHHANLIPWQELAKEKKLTLKIIPLTKDYTLDQPAYRRLLNKKTKLVCLTANSNVTGTVVPIKKMAALAHQAGALILVDAAQSAGHLPLDVKNNDCDFLAFSAHKMLGPTGVGILYVKQHLIEKMTPYMYGGEMVESVSQFSGTYQTGYGKFEAGTPNISGVIAFGAALNYLNKIGLKNIAAQSTELLSYAKKQFSKYPTVKIFSPKNINDCAGVLSFTVEGIHPHDLASIFDEMGVAIRSGLHCAEPLARSLGVASTARMSFYLYNTKKDIDAAEMALQTALKIFKIKN